MDVHQVKDNFNLFMGIAPSSRYDWESLRQNIINDGVRNSLLIALMPTASTSQISENNVLNHLQVIFIVEGQ